MVTPTGWVGCAPTTLEKNQTQDQPGEERMQPEAPIILVLAMPFCSAEKGVSGWEPAEEQAVCK